MPFPSNPPVLRIVPFDREPYRLGAMWVLHKDGKTLACELFNHAVWPWELRLLMGSELLRSEAFRSEEKLLDAADEWRKAAEAKGWRP